MADTLTANYGWTKPDPGGDSNTWGTILNATTDKIDAQVFTNQQGLVPIGAMAMWPAATSPTNWVLCDGTSYSTSGTYAALFAVVGTTYNQTGDAAGSFRVPNLAGLFPCGADGATGLGAKGGEATHTLSPPEMPTHIHGITDPGHAHGVYDPWHTHGVNDPGHYHSYGSDYGGGTGIASGSGFGQHTVNTGVSTTNVTIAVASTGVTVEGTTTGISTVNAGGNAPHNNMPPYLQINFIIKFA